LHGDRDFSRDFKTSALGIYCFLLRDPHVAKWSSTLEQGWRPMLLYRQLIVRGNGNVYLSNVVFSLWHTQADLLDRKQIFSGTLIEMRDKILQK
jgi:hypothetical protein